MPRASRQSSIRSLLKHPIQRVPRQLAPPVVPARKALLEDLLELRNIAHRFQVWRPQGRHRILVRAGPPGVYRKRLAEQGTGNFRNRDRRDLGSQQPGACLASHPGDGHLGHQTSPAISNLSLGCHHRRRGAGTRLPHTLLGGPQPGTELRWRSRHQSFFISGNGSPLPALQRKWLNNRLARGWRGFANGNRIRMLKTISQGTVFRRNDYRELCSCICLCWQNDP